MLSWRWVGFAAAMAMAMAIDYDAISWAVGGWRDEAFAFGVVMSAWSMIRLLRTPSWGTAIVLGVCVGVTWLTRLTAVTFLVPGLVYLLAFAQGPFRRRAAGILVALLASLACAGPYVFNCWRAYGDPLYAISHLAHDQLAMEAGQAGSPAAPSASASSITAGEYVMSKVAARPLRTLDTVLLGLTSYPFSNKWIGLDRWIPRLGVLLSWAALAGLLLLAGSTRGRLVLLVLATSLLPAALTWRLAADWRFTGHAYPFFLVAAGLAFGQIAVLVHALRAPERWSRGKPTLRFLGLSAMIVGIAGAAWFVSRALPFLVVSEALRARDEVTIGADGRDTPFFRDGWAAPELLGNVIQRPAVRPVSSIPLPSLPVAEYLLTIRLDPFPRPATADNVRAPVIRVFMNNTLLSTIQPGWNPERVGSYEMRVPQTSVGRGVNRLNFMIEPPATAWTGEFSTQTFAIWYVRVRPVAGS
jgi:hypothetical protein